MATRLPRLSCRIWSRRWPPCRPRIPRSTQFFRQWLETFAGYVREVDYASARPLFHPDVLAFGTHNDVIPGLDQWVTTQWDNVWPKTADFRFVHRPDLDPGVVRWHDGDRDRAVDEHGLSSRRQRVSAPGPGHDGVFKRWRWLAVRAFAHVAQSRCAAGKPCQSAGEGLVVSSAIEMQKAPDMPGAFLSRAAVSLTPAGRSRPSACRRRRRRIRACRRAGAATRRPACPS